MNRTFKDIIQKCVRCLKDYVFTKEEQEFFMKKGFPPPLHCPACRRIRRKEARKNRRKLIKTIEAAEVVKVEIVKSDDSVKIGMVPANEGLKTGGRNAA
jgi:hypothetical protein